MVVNKQAGPERLFKSREERGAYNNKVQSNHHLYVRVMGVFGKKAKAGV